MMLKSCEFETQHLNSVRSGEIGEGACKRVVREQVGVGVLKKKTFIFHFIYAIDAKR